MTNEINVFYTTRGYVIRKNGLFYDRIRRAWFEGFMLIHSSDWHGITFTDKAEAEWEAEQVAQYC